MPSETKDMPSGSRRLAIPNKKQSKKPTLFVWNWDFMQLKRRLSSKTMLMVNSAHPQDNVQTNTSWNGVIQKIKVIKICSEG
jgi:hypothetical protein